MSFESVLILFRLINFMNKLERSNITAPFKFHRKTGNGVTALPYFIKKSTFEVKQHDAFQKGEE